jgi:hypothetical protein
MRDISFSNHSNILEENTGMYLCDFVLGNGFLPVTTIEWEGKKSVKHELGQGLILLCTKKLL